MSSTMPEKTPFRSLHFSCRKMYSSDSWRLTRIKVHHPDHLQVARWTNLTIHSTPQPVEPPQHCEFNTNKDSVKNLDAFPLPRTHWKYHRLGVPTTPTSSATDGNLPLCRRSAEQLHCWAMGTGHSGLPWDEPTEQSVLPVCVAWSIQIHPVWDQEEWYEDILWQRAEGRKHHSAFPRIEKQVSCPEARG